MKPKVFHLLRIELKTSILQPGFFLNLGFVWFLIAWIFGLVIEQTSEARMSAAFWWMGMISLVLIPVYCMNQFEKSSTRARFAWLRSVGLSPVVLVLIPFCVVMVRLFILDSILLLQWFWLSLKGQPDFQLHLGSICMLLLLQMALSAQNLLLSSMTTSATRAALLATAFNWTSFALMHASSMSVKSTATEFLSALSVFGGFQNALSGLLRPADFTFALLSIPVAILLTPLVMRR